MKNSKKTSKEIFSDVISILIATSALFCGLYLVFFYLKFTDIKIWNIPIAVFYSALLSGTYGILSIAKCLKCDA